MTAGPFSSDRVDDAELVDRALKGDDTAFRVLVERYESAVASTVIGMLGPGDEADDVGQETFIRFHRSLEKYRGEEDPAGMTWEQALARVQQKNADNYLGYSDWRLPNAKEMLSIVDYSRAPDVTSSAAIDPMLNISQIMNEGGVTDYPWFWTSTTHVRANGSGSSAVYICFGRCLGYMHGSWMDVHGAGAQRSDPKEGEPAGWPTGHGPQGDAIRILNFARPVRGSG